MTKIILITDPVLQIWIMHLDYGFVLSIRIKDQDHGSGLWNTDCDNCGHDRLKRDQDLPQFYTDNFSHDDPTNDASTGGNNIKGNKY